MFITSCSEWSIAFSLLVRKHYVFNWWIIVRIVSNALVIVIEIVRNAQRPPPPPYYVSSLGIKKNLK